MRWGMAINLTRCVACYACVIVCKTEHFLPPDVSWNRVGVFEAEGIISRSIPPCAITARNRRVWRFAPPGPPSNGKTASFGWIPTDASAAASWHDGLSTRFGCSTRTQGILSGARSDPYEEMREKLYPLQLGTVSKCNFCLERMSRFAHRKRPGVDARVRLLVSMRARPRQGYRRPDDPESQVSDAIRIGGGTHSGQRRKTDPCVYYIAK